MVAAWSIICKRVLRLSPQPPGDKAGITEQYLARTRANGGMHECQAFHIPQNRYQVRRALGVIWLKLLLTDEETEVQRHEATTQGSKGRAMTRT